MVELVEQQLIETSGLLYGKATKTKPIVAKPINTLLVDQKIVDKFLLDTLEGHQMLKANSMVCMGGNNDIWQQTVEKLHKQYSPTAVDKDGWVTFQPKPENIREYYQPATSVPFQIKAQWGERQTDGTFVQYAQPGDYILRNSDLDHGVDKSGQEDVWIVAKKIFEATYEIKP